MQGRLTSVQLVPRNWHEAWWFGPQQPAGPSQMDSIPGSLSWQRSAWAVLPPADRELYGGGPPGGSLALGGQGQGEVAAAAVVVSDSLRPLSPASSPSCSRPTLSSQRSQPPFQVSLCGTLLLCSTAAHPPSLAEPWTPPSRRHPP